MIPFSSNVTLSTLGKLSAPNKALEFDDTITSSSNNEDIVATSLIFDSDAIFSSSFSVSLDVAISSFLFSMPDSDATIFLVLLSSALVPSSTKLGSVDLVDLVDSFDSLDSLVCSSEDATTVAVLSSAGSLVVVCLIFTSVVVVNSLFSLLPSSSLLVSSGSLEFSFSPCSCSPSSFIFIFVFSSSFSSSLSSPLKLLFSLNMFPSPFCSLFISLVISSSFLPPKRPGLLSSS